jgi:hypothetical protein
MQHARSLSLVWSGSVSTSRRALAVALASIALAAGCSEHFAARSWDAAGSAGTPASVPGTDTGGTDTNPSGGTDQAGQPASGAGGSGGNPASSGGMNFGGSLATGGQATSQDSGGTAPGAGGFSSTGGTPTAVGTGGLGMGGSLASPTGGASATSCFQGGPCAVGSPRCTTPTGTCSCDSGAWSCA